MPDQTRTTEMGRDPCARARRTRLRRAGVWASFAGMALSCGCENLSDIDRRIERAIAETSRDLDGGTSEPAPRTAPAPTPEYTGAQTDKNPPSNNPPPSRLRWQAREGESVAARLERLNSYSADEMGGELVTLADAFRIAQKSSREYLDAEEEYILASIRLLIERHLWGPRFFNDTTLSLNNTPAFTGGNYESALTVINTLRATQRLPYGGEVEARAIFRATEQLREVAGDSYTQSTQIVLNADIPLLRGAGLIAQEDLIQAERNLVYAARDFEDFRRRFLVQIARDYFDLVRREAGIRNQEVRLESVRQNQRRVAAQVDAGRLAAYQRRNVEQNVLRSETDLVNSREQFILALDRFKIRLGLPVSKQISLAPLAVSFPEPETSPDAAVDLAMKYRLDLQNRRDQLRDSERQVANARNQLLPDLTLRGDVSFNTPQDVRAGGVGLSFDDTVYNASATLSLPLDREIERLNLRSSIIVLNRSARELTRFEDELVLSVRQSVREIDRARFALELQEQSVRINELRLQELILKEDETDPQERLDAENELLQSRNARDAADQDLRVAILNYLTETGLMRVAPDGRFQALPGMSIEGEGVAPAPTPEEVEADTEADLRMLDAEEPALRGADAEVPRAPESLQTTPPVADDPAAPPPPPAPEAADPGA